MTKKRQGYQMSKIYILIGYDKEKDEDFVVMGGGSSTKPSPKVYLRKGMAISQAKIRSKYDSTIAAYELNLEDAERVDE